MTPSEFITFSSLYATNLSGKKILLGVSGSIAAYKSADLCRILVRLGADVHVLMTGAAREFIGSATFAALTGNPVATDLFAESQEIEIGHIRVVKGADALVVAPATANTLAKLSQGLSDDPLSTAYLAYGGPVVIAPAMNPGMWAHPAVVSNAERLTSRSAHRFVGPAYGEAACRDEGLGPMASPEVIVQALCGALSPQDFSGRRVVISGGPTREPIDSVRFLSNRSTGKMAVALAAEAVARGALEVTLVSGPTSLTPPHGVTEINVGSAAEMRDALRSAASQCDVLIMAAAVADYRPRAIESGKIKKAEKGPTWSLELSQTCDILLEVGNGDLNKKPFVVGFAAEAGDKDWPTISSKLARKGCSLMVCNRIDLESEGFGTDQNRIRIGDESGVVRELGLVSKREAASVIFSEVRRQIDQHGAKSSVQETENE